MAINGSMMHSNAPCSDVTQITAYVPPTKIKAHRTATQFHDNRDTIFYTKFGRSPNLCIPKEYRPASLSTTFIKLLGQVARDAHTVEMISALLRAVIELRMNGRVQRKNPIKVALVTDLKCIISLLADDSTLLRTALQLPLIIDLETVSEPKLFRSTRGVKRAMLTQKYWRNAATQSVPQKPQTKALKGLSRVSGANRASQRSEVDQHPKWRFWLYQEMYMEPNFCPPLYVNQEVAEYLGDDDTLALEVEMMEAREAQTEDHTNAVLRMWAEKHVPKVLEC